ADDGSGGAGHEGHGGAIAATAHSAGLDRADNDGRRPVEGFRTADVVLGHLRAPRLMARPGRGTVLQGARGGAKQRRTVLTDESVIGRMSAAIDQSPAIGPVIAALRVIGAIGGPAPFDPPLIAIVVAMSLAVTA